MPEDNNNDIWNPWVKGGEPSNTSGSLGLGTGNSDNEEGSGGCPCGVYCDFFVNENGSCINYGAEGCACDLENDDEDESEENKEGNKEAKQDEGENEDGYRPDRSEETLERENIREDIRGDGLGPEDLGSEAGGAVGGGAATAGGVGATAEGAAAAAEGTAAVAEGAAATAEGAATIFEILAAIGPWGWLVIAIILLLLIIMALILWPKDSAYGNTVNNSATTIICVDPGHPSELGSSTTQADYDADEANWNKNKTGANGGTAGGGVNERVINQQVADKLTQELTSRGYKVFETKTDSEKFMSNRARGEFCKSNNANVIVKIHNDGSTAPRPGMIFYRSNKTVIQSNWDKVNELGTYMSRRTDATIAEDKKLGESMDKAFTAGEGKYSYSYPDTLLVHPTNAAFGYTFDIPTTLLEMSKMSDASNLNFIKDSSNQTKISKAFADGIEGYMPPNTGGSGLCQPLKSPNPTSTKGFVQLPQNSTEFKQNGGSPGSQQWGTPETIALLEGVAKEWNKRHPTLKIMYGDISLINGGVFGQHESHTVGIDIDVTSHTNPSFISTDSNYDKNLAIELAKLFLDTKANVYILYNDTSIHSTVNNYASDNKLQGQMKSWPGHANHFHVRIDPSSYAKACGFTESAAGKAGDAWLRARNQDGG